jgi:uncharacterized membrane protein
MVSVRQSLTISGPLPSPEILVKYNEAVPDGAERIMKMAEHQAQHRIGLEASVIAANIEAQKRGSLYAFILGMTGILGGIGLIVAGRSTEGLTSLITSLTVLLGVFIVGKVQQQKERREKLAPPPQISN